MITAIATLCLASGIVTGTIIGIVTYKVTEAIVGIVLGISSGIATFATMVWCLYTQNYDNDDDASNEYEYEK